MTGVLLMLLSVSGYAQDTVQNVFGLSSTGTTSATVIIPEGAGFANVTDLAYRLDSAVTTGTVGIRMGQVKYPITSSTASAASVLWITNTGTAVAALEYVIVYDASAGTYYLRRVSAATTTSITIDSSISITTETADYVWSTFDTVEKPVSNTTSATIGNGSMLGVLWLPANAPSALTIDGNTTACRISVNGVRTRNR